MSIAVNLRRLNTFYFFICNYVCSCEDEGSDKEASVESDAEKSTEDDESSSETETVSASPSESEEVRHISFGRWNLNIDGTY